MRRGLTAILMGLTLCGAVWLLWPRPTPGIRDLPFSAQAPEGRPLHIVAFGTSLTARALWPDQVAESLSACIGAPVTAARIATAGANSADGLQMIERVIGQNPDLVFVEFAINDADILDGLSPRKSRDMHAAIIRKLRTARPDLAIVLIATNPASGLRGLARPRLDAYYGAYPEIAQSEGTGFLAAYPRWLAKGTGAITDGLHPEPDAEADLMRAPLVTLVAQAYGFDC
ncbi:MAG: SGNH/GDSL hydrolase family protein [Albidovulum sp.]